MKLCGIGMEDDDFEMENEMETSASQNQTHIYDNVSDQSKIVPSTPGSDIMITIPSSQHSDTPFTFTIPTTVDGSIKKNESEIKSPEPFMITIDTSGENGQPYTISIPQTLENPKSVATSICDVGSPQSTMCVPTFINSVLSTAVTPTLQSQINEIQNQLMGVIPTSTYTPTSTVVTSTSSAITAPITTATPAKPAKKKPGKKSKKAEALAAAAAAAQMATQTAANQVASAVPSQIGNIQISQVDCHKNSRTSIINNKIIDNQIQITPIMEQNRLNLQNQTQSQHSMIATSIQQTNNIITSPPSSTSSNVHNSVVQHIHQGLISSQNNAQISGLMAANPTTLQQHPPSQPQVQTQPTQPPLIPQLSGNLSLALEEDGRLVLKHNANLPHNTDSQVILQAILSGALGNVTLVNEPTTTPPITQTQSQLQGPSNPISNTQQQIVIPPQPQQQQQQQSSTCIVDNIKLMQTNKMNNKPVAQQHPQQFMQQNQPQQSPQIQALSNQQTTNAIYSNTGELL